MFQSISVGKLISNLFKEKEEAQDTLDGIDEYGKEVMFFINNSDLDDNNDDDIIFKFYVRCQANLVVT